MSSSLPQDAWSVRLRTTAPHRLIAYTDAEIEAAIERQLDELEDEHEDELVTVRHEPTGSADGIVEQFFADGEALSKQHRLESEAIARSEGFATVKLPWWRRIWTRRRMVAPARGACSAQRT